MYGLMNWRLGILSVLLVAACSREVVQEKTVAAKKKVEETFDDVAVPWARTETHQRNEQERFDERWRELASFRAQQARQQQQRRQAQQAKDVRFVTGVKETLDNLNVAALNATPVAIPIQGDVSGPSVLKTQVYLDRLRFSVGALDGRWGKNSAIAVWWFQRSRGLPETGVVDEATFRTLAGEAGGQPAVVAHQLTAADVEGPFVKIPDDVYDKEKLDCLCYESAGEKLAETFHTTQELLKKLNPNVDLAQLAAGTSINVPNVRQNVTTEQPDDIARIVVSIAGNTFNAYNAAGDLIFHAPTTLGSQYDPSPSETVKVAKIAHDPHFHYQPTLFHEVPDSDPEANLNPGPNSPVGVVWIALTKPHFGIHGTSDPDSIGYASSHGCVRLANWDAREVSYRVAEGVPVEFVDTRKKD
jgi:lipoprotein-anchoring transpeptidase ErfK/SrfK